MDELENDKIVYWFVFFGILIVIAIFGHNYVFKYVNEKKEQNEVGSEEETFNMDDYFGVWQFFGDDELPLQELVINVINGSTITFDYYVNGVAYFESQTAILEEETASFLMSDRDNLGTVNGKFTFRHDKIYFVISYSDIEGVVAGTYQFTDKGDYSLLD